MKKSNKLESFIEQLRLIGEVFKQTQAVQSPKMQTVLKGLQSIDQVQQTMKQAQQLQTLMQCGKKDQSSQSSVENALPLLLLLLNNLPHKTTDSET